MKILALADKECAYLWDFYSPGKLAEYDLILSCGDLKASYLRFLVTMARCPLLYVHGNHDEHYETDRPEGCDLIDDHFVVYNGIRILGLGGCRKYHEGPHQYTEAQMRHRINRLRYQLWRHKGVDIVVTHAPPEDLGDAPDPAHRGFSCLRWLLEEYRPQYLIHGHVHMTYGHHVPRQIRYGDTTIINAYERHSFEIPDREYPRKERGQVLYKTRYRVDDMDYEI